MRMLKGIGTAALCSLGLSVGCGGGEEAEAAASATAPPKKPTAAPAVPEATTHAEEGLPNAGAAEYPDESFVETERNRDPFRTYLALFETKELVEPQREVLMSNVGIDEMRLTAIISGIPSPRALLVDPLGVGYVVQRGDFVGRPEVLQVESDSPPLMLNWRVSRVRGAEPGTDRGAQVVLTRENPLSPDQPPLSRVLPLGSESNTP